MPRLHASFLRTIQGEPAVLHISRTSALEQAGNASIWLCSESGQLTKSAAFQSKAAAVPVSCNNKTVLCNTRRPGEARQSEAKFKIWFEIISAFHINPMLKYERG